MRKAVILRLATILPALYVWVASFTLWNVSDTSRTDPIVMVYILYIMPTAFLIAGVVQLVLQRALVRE